MSPQAHITAVCVLYYYCTRAERGTFWFTPILFLKTVQGINFVLSGTTFTKVKLETTEKGGCDENLDSLHEPGDLVTKPRI